MSWQLARRADRLNPSTIDQALAAPGQAAA